MIHKIFKTYVFPFVFLLMVGKALVFGANWSQVAFAAILGVWLGIVEYKSAEAIIGEIRGSLKEHREALDKIEKDMTETRSFVSSMKLSNSFKTTQIGR
jgi:hypothetical protein